MRVATQQRIIYSQQTPPLLRKTHPLLPIEGAIASAVYGRTRRGMRVKVTPPEAGRSLLLLLRVQSLGR